MGSDSVRALEEHVKHTGHPTDERPGFASADQAEAPVTVVGCGNWLIREDRVGPRVLAALRTRPAEGVELRDVGTSVLGLLDWLRGQELVVLIDACAGVGEPGEIRIAEPCLDEIVAIRATSHQIGPLDTLAVARELYPERMPERLILVQVETAALPLEREAEVCARAVAAVEQAIAEWWASSGRERSVDGAYEAQLADSVDSADAAAGG